MYRAIDEATCWAKSKLWCAHFGPLSGIGDDPSGGGLKDSPTVKNW